MLLREERALMETNWSHSNAGSAIYDNGRAIIHRVPHTVMTYEGYETALSVSPTKAHSAHEARRPTCCKA